MASRKGSGKVTALAVLRAVTKLISNMSEEELEALASGSASLTITMPETSSRPASRAYDQPESKELDYSKLRDELRAAESTEAGFAILDDARLSRSELERMARSLDLPVLKQDSILRLVEKIVEALIGSRLNSRAVRGR
jgi:hypothetical protein